MIYFLLMLMMVAWSGNFLITKVTLRELPPFALLFLRVLLSNLILLALALRRGSRRPRLLQGDWRWFALLGFFGIAMNQLGFTLGVLYTSLAHSSLLVTLTPIFVLLLATRMRMEALTATKVTGMLVSFAGVAVLTLEHGQGASSATFLGDVISLGSSVAFALYTVYSKQVSQRYDTLGITLFSYAAGFLFVIPLGAWELAEVNWVEVSWRAWAGVAYMAAVASVAAYMIFYFALSRISASRVIAFSYLQPVLVTLLGVVFLREALTTYVIGGGSLVLLGVYLAERGRA
ncbi:MAG: DMT family transporter [Candidatus Acidiferrales bacterium]